MIFWHTLSKKARSCSTSKSVGRKLRIRVFQLHTAVHVDIIKRFVPYIEMRLLAKAAGKQQLLFLPFGVLGDILVKLLPSEIHIAQDGLEQCFIGGCLCDKAVQISVQMLGGLRHIADLQPACDADFACQRIWKSRRLF